MQFASPYFLWLLAVIPLMVVYYVWRTRQGGASIQVSTIDGVAEAPRTVRYYLRHLPFALRCAAVALLIVALARPQSVDEGSTSNTEGIDIVLAIDISTSMLAQDLQPDRIQAAKQVAGNFITDRPGDRIGLVAFAGEAFTQSPLTTDQGTLQTLLGRLRSGVVEDGTAIGNGLATAINRLRESNAKSKVIILLTDGENNRGEIAPLTAAEIARDQGIRVYTIGVGTRGTGRRLMARYARKVRDIFRPAPPLPPHIAAIQALETLHNQKLWQSGRHKQYYSGLTDILRTYLAGRYGFGAMEMTSDEILAAVRRYDLPQKCVMDLQAILRDADLAKFAKAQSEGTTNEDNYLNAYYFVEETKPAEIAEEGTEQDDTQ